MVDFVNLTKCEKIKEDKPKQTTDSKMIFRIYFKKCVFILELQLRRKYIKLATVVDGDPKVRFSIASTPKCRGGRFSFSWIAPLYP